MGSDTAVIEKGGRFTYIITYLLHGAESFLRR